MRLHTAPLPRGEFLRDVPLLDEFVHRVGRAALSGAVVLEQTWVLFIQRLLPPENQMKSEHDALRKYTAADSPARNCFRPKHINPESLFVPLQFFFFKFQLQHDSAELHVEVVRPL